MCLSTLMHICKTFSPPGSEFRKIVRRGYALRFQRIACLYNRAVKKVERIDFVNLSDDNSV